MIKKLREYVRELLTGERKSSDAPVAPPQLARRTDKPSEAASKPSSQSAVRPVPPVLAALGFRVRASIKVPPRDEWSALLGSLRVFRIAEHTTPCVLLPASTLSAADVRTVAWDSDTCVVYVSDDTEVYVHVEPATPDVATGVRERFAVFLESMAAAGHIRKSAVRHALPVARPMTSGASVAPMPDRNIAAADEPELALDEGQERLIARLNDESTPFSLVTGAAGTGKSVVVRELLRARGTLVVAPTGMAARAVGGMTVHRAFGFPTSLCEPRRLSRPEEPTVATLRQIRRLVIDEVSMLRADLLDAIDVTLRAVHGSTVPFGGVQVVMVGDPFQLPPVATNNDRTQLTAWGYRTTFFYSARVVKQCRPVHFELQRQHRQSDATFLGILHRIRRGHHHAGDLSRLNKRVRGARGRTADGVILCTRNADADVLNAERLSALAMPLQRYFAYDDWPDPDKPAESCITLAVGARVLFTKNDADRRWVNGSRGVVTRLGETTVHVRVDDGDEFEVAPATWELREPLESTAPKVPMDESEEDEGLVHWGREANPDGDLDAPTSVAPNVAGESDDELRWRVLGRFRQLPLRLGWAITIHKSQGMTLERAVIDLGSHTFATGQLYVALSRLRRLDDLTLTRPIRPADVMVEPSTEQFLTWLKVP